VATLPFQTIRVLDVEQVAARDMDVHDRERLRAQLRRLARCRTGQRLLRIAVDQRLVVRWAVGEELVRPGGRAGGYYRSRARLLVLDREVDDDTQLATLAHELQHFVDEVLGWPLGTVQCEVRAQQTAGQVVRQLGLRAAVWGLTATGEVRHPEDIAEQVRAHPMYAFNPEEPPRGDDQLHPLLAAHEVLPPTCTVSSAAGAGGTRVGAVGQVARTAASRAVTAVPTGPVAQAAGAALGAGNPTGFDPNPVSGDRDSEVGRFLLALDARRLATGA
jgi:hypothetical protein